jgi:hypothetical protein
MQLARSRPQECLHIEVYSQLRCAINTRLFLGVPAAARPKRCKLGKSFKGVGSRIRAPAYITMPFDVLSSMDRGSYHGEVQHGAGYVSTRRRTSLTTGFVDAVFGVRRRTVPRMRGSLEPMFSLPDAGSRHAEPLAPA